MTDKPSINDALAKLQLKIQTGDTYGVAFARNIPWERYAAIGVFRRDKKRDTGMLKSMEFEQHKEDAYGNNLYAIEEDALGKKRFPFNNLDRLDVEDNQWSDEHGTSTRRIKGFRGNPTTFGRKFVSPVVKRVFDEDFMLPLNGAEYRALKALWLMREFIDDDDNLKPFASSWKDFRRSLNGSPGDDVIYIAYCRGFAFMKSDGTLHTRKGYTNDEDAV